MNLIQISDKFPAELDAIKYFEKTRWGNQPRCAYCDSKNLCPRSKDFRHKCMDCKSTSSVTANTFLQGTNMDLKKWLFAFSLITDAKKGLSAIQLQRNLSISYPTALNMYHKIRDLMSIENDAIRLDGIVEMDETFIGGKPRKFVDGTTTRPIKPTVIPALDERIRELKAEGISFNRKRGNPAHSSENPKRGRGTTNIPVVGIVERDGNVVAEVQHNLTGFQLRKMVEKYVDTDESVLITDTYAGYSRMDSIIENVKIDHHRLYSYKGINTNSIESFWAIIKRQIIGQHHQVSAKHLPRYVAEAVFKYNNRNEDDMFETLVKNAMLPLKIKDLPNAL